MKKYYFIAAVLGIALAAGKSTFYKPNPKTPAIVAASKAYPGGFQVFITANLISDDSFELEGNIHSDKGSGEFEFQWILPDGVKLVSGSVAPTLVFGANSSAQTKIVIQVEDKNQNYQIVGEAYRVHDDENVQGAVAQFNTNSDALPNQQHLAKVKKGRILQ